MQRFTIGLVLATVLAVAGTAGTLAQKQTTYEMLGGFGVDLSAMIRDDLLGRPYVTEKVSGWANFDFMYTTSGRLMFQVTYPPPDPTRYVELDFSQQVTPGAPPLGDKLSCLQVSSSGETYGQPFAGPAVPQFLKGVDHRVRALYFRLSSDFEWFFDGGKWTTAKGRYLSLAAMPDNGAPRYFKGWISVDVAELEVNGAGPNLNLAFNGQGLNPIGDEGGYLKVVRYGQQWTITPVSAGEAGLSGGSTAHLSLSVQTPDKRNYTSRNGNCDLGTFNMPFSLTLTCDASRGSCPLPAGPVQ